MESILSENINIKSFLDALSQIRDERDNRGKHHDLSFIIMIFPLSLRLLYWPYYVVDQELRAFIAL